MNVDRLSAKYVKFIKDGLYELRIEWQGNIYRIFFCFDEGQIVIQWLSEKSEENTR